jgi:hypothetical protein
MNILEAKEIMKHWIEYMKENKEKIYKVDEVIEIQEIVLSELDSKDKEIEALKEKLNTDWNIEIEKSYDREFKRGEQEGKLSYIKEIRNYLAKEEK